MSTRTRFEKEAKGNSEMAYWSRLRVRDARGYDKLKILGLTSPNAETRPVKGHGADPKYPFSKKMCQEFYSLTEQQYLTYFFSLFSFFAFQSLACLLCVSSAPDTVFPAM